MLIARAVLALALVAPETSAGGPTRPGSEITQLDQELRQLILSIASPIAVASTVAEFETELRKAAARPEFPKLLVEIARLTLRRPGLAKLPTNLDTILQLYVRTFGEAHAGKLRQVFDMSLELADRSATLVGPLLEEEELSEERLSQELARIRDDDEDALHYIHSMVCGLVASAAAEGGVELSESEDVRAAIVNCWVEGTKWILEATDPVQAALDEALDSIQVRPYGQHLFRLAYSRNRYGVTGEPVLVVWLVFLDDAPDSALDLVADPKIQALVKAELRKVEGLQSIPVYFRAQLASEIGPAEELLADGA